MAEQKGEPLSGRQDSAQPLLVLEDGQGPEWPRCHSWWDGAAVWELRDSEHVGALAPRSCKVSLEGKVDIRKDEAAQAS